MKKTEIAMIVLIASMSMAVTFFVVRTIFGDNIKKEKTVPIVTEVRDELIPPSKLIFNEKAINPTVEVYVEESVTSGMSQDSEKPKNDSDAQDPSKQVESSE
jgi:hypothetical protein